MPTQTSSLRADGREEYEQQRLAGSLAEVHTIGGIRISGNLRDCGVEQHETAGCLCEKITQHLNIAWNPATKEWFCTKCGRTSDHASENDPHAELDQYECQAPSVEGTTTTPGTKTMRLSKKSYKMLKPEREK